MNGADGGGGAGGGAGGAGGVPAGGAGASGASPNPPNPLNQLIAALNMLHQHNRCPIPTFSGLPHEDPYPIQAEGTGLYGRCPNPSNGPHP